MTNTDELLGRLTGIEIALACLIAKSPEGADLKRTIREFAALSMADAKSTGQLPEQVAAVETAMNSVLDRILIDQATGAVPA